MMIKHQQLKNIINQIKYMTVNIAFENIISLKI